MRLIQLKKALLIAFTGSCAINSFAQSPVSVSPLTGAVNVAIPIYTVNSGQVSLPITLFYSSSGIKPTDVEGTTGIGWQLSAGGQITRQVRGIPDDVVKDVAGNNMYGWMSTSNTFASNIGIFNIQNDGGVTCSKETTDITNINTYFPYNFDTEPDMFYVNAPGLSCQLVYDRTTAQFHPVKYQDLVITYATDPTFGTIYSFTITNDKGIKYVFSSEEKVSEVTSATGTPQYFATKFKQYQHTIDYDDAWNLTSITDPNGNGVILDYTPVASRTGIDQVNLYMPGSTTATLQYYIGQTVTQQLLADIKTTNFYVTSQVFTVNSYITGGVLGALRGTGQTLINKMTGMGHTYMFNYSPVGTSGGTYSKYFLRSFGDVGCNSPNSYQFSYAGETLAGSVYTTLLPDSGTNKIDYWGFYANNTNTLLHPTISVNPTTAGYQRYAVYEAANNLTVYPYITTNGNNRYADLTNIGTGSLNGITYATGGTTTITYEPNSYKDVPSGTEFKGGGVRVKQITDNSINNPAIIRNYTYIDPATGLSSGKPITLPAFAFTIPYSGTATGSALWNANTVVSDYDLSNEDHTILYSYFKMSQTGAGSTQYHNYVPATNWDNSAIPACSGCSTAEWAPTITDVARSNCSLTYGPVKNDIYAYPFTPNPNYDFERGMPLDVISYTDAGTKVAETDYTYQRSFTPSVITAFKYDDDPNGTLSVRAYNKYKIYYNTSELTATVKKTVYDSPTLAQAQSSTATYTYGSTHHKLLTQQSVTNSDNSVLTTNISYTKDYTAAAGTNANVSAIYYLQQQNMNIPVETWQQVTRSGTVKTTGAALTLFSNFPGASSMLYLPAQQYTLTQPDGIPSTASPAAFAPLVISGQTLTKDSRYNLVGNFDNYDLTGSLQTLDAANYHPQTSLMDHSTYQATAAIDNAAVGEVAFNDFDTDPAYPQDYNFTFTGTTSFAANGSHNGNAYGFGVGQTATTSITKNPLTKNYIFSIWINAATAGTLTFTLNSGTPTTYTMSYAAEGWKYYAMKIPVASVATTFTFTVASSQAISIDDLLLYPDVAQVSTFAYDPMTHLKTGQTNTNGVSAYFQSDQYGRLLYSYDQDKNIVEKKSYFSSDQLTTGEDTLVVQFSPSTVNQAIPVTFMASVPCLSGISYSWDFGDGVTIPSTLNASKETHTYTSSGSKTVVVKATHPAIGTQTYTQTIPVELPPITPQICISGVTIWNTCSNSAVHTVTCGSNPTSTTDSYYTVNPFANAIGTISYQWKISYDGGTTWINYSGTTNQVDIPHDESAVPYQIKCVVTTSGGQTATTNIAQLSVVTHC